MNFKYLTQFMNKNILIVFKYNNSLTKTFINICI